MTFSRNPKKWRPLQEAKAGAPPQPPRPLKGRKLPSREAKQKATTARFGAANAQNFPLVRQWSTCY